MNQQYQELKAGDVRQFRDQVRCHEKSGTPFVAEDTYPKWRGCSLIGHMILISDLIHLNFRRPL